MANRKISDLAALTTPASGDYLPIVDVSEAAAADKNKRITVEELMRGVPDGTAGAPGIAFESDPNTGIYSPGADQLALATAGTGRLFIDSSGRVGIGTTSPASTLHVNGDVTITDKIIHSGDTNTAIRFPANDTVSIETAGTERMRIDSSGRVGIGTSAPQSLLHLLGNTPRLHIQDNAGTGNTARPGINFYDSASTVIGDFAFDSIGNSNLIIRNYTSTGNIRFSTNNQVRMLLDSSGRVGIGTTSPGALTHIYGSNSGATASGTLVVEQGSAPSIQILSANTQTPEIRFGDPQDNNIGRIQYSHANDSMGFIANASEAARIDSSGRLLVGTSSALGASKLETLGNSFPSSAILARINSNDINPTGFVCAKDRAGAVVQNNDQLGACVFRGYDGSNYKDAAFIRAEVDGTPGANDMPGRLVFSTTADGASSPTERMRIDSSGGVTIGNSVLYSGETGAVTGATGTTVFSFDFSGGSTRRTHLIKIFVMHKVEANNISAQPSAEYVFAAEGYTTGAAAATSPTAVFENVYVAATHFAFASTGSTSFTITLTNPSASASSNVSYRVEILGTPSGLTLTSVATT